MPNSILRRKQPPAVFLNGGKSGRQLGGNKPWHLGNYTDTIYRGKNMEWAQNGDTELHANHPQLYEETAG